MPERCSDRWRPDHFDRPGRLARGVHTGLTTYKRWRVDSVMPRLPGWQVGASHADRAPSSRPCEWVSQLPGASIERTAGADSTVNTDTDAGAAQRGADPNTEKGLRSDVGVSTTLVRREFTNRTSLSGSLQMTGRSRWRPTGQRRSRGNRTIRAVYPSTQNRLMRCRVNSADGCSCRHREPPSKSSCPLISARRRGAGHHNGMKIAHCSTAGFLHFHPRPRPVCTAMQIDRPGAESGTLTLNGFLALLRKVPGGGVAVSFVSAGSCRARTRYQIILTWALEFSYVSDFIP